jgi:hypothetical protein
MLNKLVHAVVITCVFSVLASHTAPIAPRQPSLNPTTSASLQLQNPYALTHRVLVQGRTD